jgi:hypothetical protein
VVHQEGESVESTLQHRGVMTDIKDGCGTERSTSSITQEGAQFVRLMAST